MWITRSDRQNHCEHKLVYILCCRFCLQASDQTLQEAAVLGATGTKKKKRTKQSLPSLNQSDYRSGFFNKQLPNASTRCANVPAVYSAGSCDSAELPADCSFPCVPSDDEVWFRITGKIKNLFGAKFI